MPAFSKTSLSRLYTCHPDLQKLFLEVIRDRDCTIICGYRGPEDQEKAFADGKSKAHYGQSRHNNYPSRAIDVMPYPINWDDIEGIKAFADFVKTTAIKLGIEIRWGGEFKSFFDGPHYELTN